MTTLAPMSKSYETTSEVPDRANGVAPAARQSGQLSGGRDAPGLSPRHRRLRLPAVPRLRRPPPGTPAGIEYHELTRKPGAATARVVCTDYCPERIEIQEIADIAAFVPVHRPDWSRVRWIHVEGLQDRDVIRALAEKYRLHPLAIEDMLDGAHRPKLDDYPGIDELPGRLFVVAGRVQQLEGCLQAEQLSLFLGRNTLLTFEQVASPAIEEVRRRLQSSRSRLRGNDASFLLYALLDAVVDRLFPVLDEVSARLEAAEEEVLTRPDPQSLPAIHRIKRDLVAIRRVAWPMRELIAELQRERHECLSEITQTYFRDLYDQCVQAIDLIETYREIASAVAETHVSVVSNRTNEIMKVLTVIGTIFIPLTFLAGIYGMNMPIPENGWRYSYPVFWAVCLGIAGLMLWRFRRGGWL